MFNMAWDNGYHSSIQSLLTRTDLDITFTETNTEVFYRACKYGYDRIIFMLLKQRHKVAHPCSDRCFCINRKNKDDKTGLELAVNDRHYGVVELLLDCEEICVPFSFDFSDTDNQMNDLFKKWLGTG